MKNPIAFIVHKYLENNGYHFDLDEINLQLFSHPDFPNVIAVSDLFQHFDIANFALQLDKAMIQLEQLPDSFLAHISDSKSDRLVLAQKKGKKLKLYIDEHNKKMVSYETFLTEWSGVLISFEEVTSNSLWHLFDKKKLFRIFIYVAVGLFLGAFIYSSSPPIYPMVSFILGGAGFAFSILIVQQELGVKSGALYKFCTAFENASCQAVTNSKGASLFGIIKLSDIGIIYFSAQLLLWLFAFFSGSSFQEIFIGISILSIPFTAYSLIYQWRVVKKWCLLCLGVVGVLYLQFFSGFLTDFSFLELPTLSVMVLSGLAFLGIAALWLFIKPLLRKEQDLNILKIKNLKFKRNFNFFKIVLQNSIKVDALDLYGDIVLGNPNASLELVLVSNPTCFYCKDAHNSIENLLKNYHDQIKVIIRFSIPSQDPTHEGLLMAHHLLSIYKQMGEAKCQKVLHEVYTLEKSERKFWITAQNVALDQNLLAMLEAQRVWTLEQGVYLTPTLIVNQQVYPRASYEIDELPYFIDELLLEAQNQSLAVV